MLCFIEKDGSLLLEKPLSRPRVLQQMARQAGIVGKVTSHSVRRGAARDYAHASEAQLSVSDMQVAWRTG